MATCRLVDVVPTDHVGEMPGWLDAAGFGGDVWVSKPEAACGDYSPGRFAWVLTHIVPLPEPIPAKGFQRLWEWTPAVAEP